jgi:hypothetical protein
VLFYRCLHLYQRILLPRKTTVNAAEEFSWLQRLKFGPSFLKKCIIQDVSKMLRQNSKVRSSYHNKEKSLCKGTFCSAQSCSRPLFSQRWRMFRLTRQCYRTRHINLPSEDNCSENATSVWVTQTQLMAFDCKVVPVLSGNGMWRSNVHCSLSFTYL